MTVTTPNTDLDIQSAALKELAWDPRVNSTGISVQVKNGIVALSGSVDTYAQQVAACEAVRHIAGVLDVDDDLEVRIPGQPKSDQEIAQAVRNALLWDVYVPEKRIASTVSDGWVTLEGDVDFWHQHEDALRAVERLSGVRGITNRVVVKSQTVDSAKTRKSIEDALMRRVGREREPIKIDVEDGVVTLTGEVPSWSAKSAIDRVAAYSPGVKRIVNQIVIRPHS